MPVIDIQRRFAELGRIRLGTKTEKGYPKRLTKFRLTSASKALLEGAAAQYGGTPQPWESGPEEGLWELYTETAELDVLLPPVLSQTDGTPTLPYSQWYELWSAGGCQRRCDGKTEILTNKPCLCRTDGLEPGDDDACGITTRLSVMLPKVPGLGVWTLQTGGWNAAAILPGTLDILMLAASQRQFIPAVLRLESRTSKRDGETHRFVVPVVDLPETRLEDFLADQLGLSASGSPEPALINPPSPRGPKPELPPAADVVPTDAPTAVEPEEVPLGEPAVEPSAEPIEETVVEPEPVVEAAPAPEPEPSPEQTPDDLEVARLSLADELFRTAEQLDGVDLEKVIVAVNTNRTEHTQSGTMAQHVAWLESQVEDATARLERERAAAGQAAS